MCHIIIASCSILIARMAKPASKTKKTFQANLGSLAKADTTGKKRSASSKTLLLQSATNKRRVNFLHPMPLILLLPLMTTTLILLLTTMLMLSWLVFQIIPFYLSKNCKVMFLTMMKTKKMMMTAMTMTIILEWCIMLLFMMEEKTLLLLTINLDYQLALTVQMSLQI